MMGDRSWLADEGDIDAAFADLDDELALDRAVGSSDSNHDSRLAQNDGSGGFDETIESVTVRWPGGDTDAMTGLAPDGRHRVVEGSGQEEALP